MKGEQSPPSPFYPLMLDLRGKKCLVVGGGIAATKRIRTLREAGAAVKVVAPEVSREVREMATDGGISWEARDFRPEDLEGHFLALAMSDSPEVNTEVEEACRSRGMLVCSNSSRSTGDVIFPSVIRKGEITIAISTGGKSPALSRMLREELEGVLDERISLLCQVFGEARRELKKRGIRAGYEQWMCALDDGLLELIESGKVKEAESRLLHSLHRQLDGRRSLLVWGLSHRASPLSVIEELACDAASREELLRELKGYLESVLVLGTCNRFEIYCFATTAELWEALEKVVKKRFSRQAGEMSRPYLLADREAIRHILKVACGLDSLVPGESQIRSQLRKAARAADSVGALRSPLRELLQRIMASSREIHRGLKNQGPEKSIMGAAVERLSDLLEDLEKPRILVIGTGQAGLTSLRLLKAKGYGDLALVGSDPGRLVDLSRRLGVAVATYDSLEEELLQADGVISASPRREPLMGREELARLVERRSGRPLLIVDIAVPRDFPRDCSLVEKVTLLGMEDLRAQGSPGTPHLDAMAERVEREVERICTWWGERRISPLAVLVRREADDLKERTLEEICARLGIAGEDRRFLEERLNLLLNRVLHRPIQLVKAACGRLSETLEGEGEP